MAHFLKIFLFVATLLSTSAILGQDASMGSDPWNCDRCLGRTNRRGERGFFVNSATGIRYSETTGADGRFAFELVPAWRLPGTRREHGYVPADYASFARRCGRRCGTRIQIIVAVRTRDGRTKSLEIVTGPLVRESIVAGIRPGSAR